MKNLKTVKCIILLALIILGLSIEAKAFGADGGGEGIGLGRGNGIGGNIGLTKGLFSPTQLPLFNKFKLAPEITVTPVEILYAVQITQSSDHPVTCKQVTDSINLEQHNDLIQSQITDKINKGTILTREEITTLRKIQVGDSDLQEDVKKEIEISIDWTFMHSDRRYDSYSKISSRASEFRNFTVAGPGLRWDATNSTSLPNFLVVALNHGVQLKYKMSVFDFCFGENEVVMMSSGEGSNGVTPLRASWNQDLSEDHQAGIYSAKNDVDYNLKAR